MNMKVFIASDIHGSAYWCKRMLDAVEREGADRILLLGDLLYHGPRNDLPLEYAPKQVISMLNGVKDRILCVRGNCDTEVDQMVLEFPIMAEWGWLMLGGRSVLATHGHKLDGAGCPALRPGDLLLCGHTHVPACESRGDYTYINPGSVSIPKENSQQSYILATDDLLEWKTFDGDIYRTFKL